MVDIGSSFLPSSLQAAFLYAQLCDGLKINEKRKNIFQHYHKFFSNILSHYNINIPTIFPHTEPPSLFDFHGRVGNELKHRHMTFQLQECCHKT